MIRTLNQNQKLKDRLIERNSKKLETSRHRSINKKIVYIIFAVFFVTIVLFFDSNFKHESDLINKSIKGLVTGLKHANVSETVRDNISQDYISYLENAETTSRIKDFFVFSISIMTLLIFIIIVDHLVDPTEDKSIKDPNTVGDYNMLDSSSSIIPHKEFTRNKKRYYRRNYKIKKKIR